MLWYDMICSGMASHGTGIYVCTQVDAVLAMRVSQSFSACQNAHLEQDEIPEDATKQEPERRQKSATHFCGLPVTPATSITGSSKQIWPAVGYCFVRAEQLARWINSGVQEADKVRVCNLSDVPHHASTTLGARDRHQGKIARLLHG